MKTFYQVITNNLIAILANNFVWFALSFWAYAVTKSVMTTAYFNACFIVVNASLAFLFGSIVDHNKKKKVMMGSSLVTLVFFIFATIFYYFTPSVAFSDIKNPAIWIFMALNLVAIIAGNIRNILTPTLVTLLVPKDKRDRMNGLSGMIFGISGSIAGIFSGLTLGFSGMFAVQIAAILIITITIVQLLFTQIPEPEILNEHPENDTKKKSNIKQTIKIVAEIPGLFPLIFYSTFNNLLGGVFLALLDPYGIELTSVQTWGIMWGVLSTGFILGGIFIARKGLGKNPIKKLFIINIIMWINSMIFPLKESVIMLSIGIVIWTLLVPYLEAIEQTVIQKVVPYQKQGRVFGLAQSIEMSASPLTAFIIAPFANFIIIPSMTSGYLANTIGPYFGTTPNRGIALVFIIAAFIGLITTLIAMYSRGYKVLSKNFNEG
jgi:DHA3 family multidrug efflux protein-like MFS transporter